MDTSNDIAAKRFKQIRESHHYTQSAFASLLGVKNSTADIERGRTKISGSVVAALLKKFEINPLWLFGESSQKILSLHGGDVSPKVVTVDTADSENMVLVNVKAAAGYPNNILDLDWYKELPAFDLPLPEYRNATYRGFQVSGDSMLPGLEPNDWVIGKGISDLSEIGNNSICVIVLVDSVLVKKIHKNHDVSIITLISLNTDYVPITIDTHEILELWEVNSKLSFQIDKSSEITSIQQLQYAMEELRNEVKGLKK